MKVKNLKIENNIIWYNASFRFSGIIQKKNRQMEIGMNWKGVCGNFEVNTKSSYSEKKISSD